MSPLNGISRGKLIDALGPAQFCTGQTAAQPSGFPAKEDCPAEQNPQWSFYRHVDATVTGGGPELICEANGLAYCATVEWRRSR